MADNPNAEVVVTDPLDERIRLYFRRHWAGVQLAAVAAAAVPFAVIPAVMGAVEDAGWIWAIVPAFWIPAVYLYMVGLTFGSEAEAEAAERGRSESVDI